MKYKTSYINHAISVLRILIYSSYVNKEVLFSNEVCFHFCKSLVAIVPPAVLRLEANTGHKPYDTVNITKTECQLRLDPWIKPLMYPVIQKETLFIIYLLSFDLSTNIQCIKRDYGCIRGLKVS